GLWYRARASALAAALGGEQTGGIEIGRQALAARVEHAVSGDDGFWRTVQDMQFDFPVLGCECDPASLADAKGEPDLLGNGDLAFAGNSRCLHDVLRQGF